MAEASKFLGLPAAGYLVASRTPSVAGEPAVTVYRGPAETLETWSAAALANHAGTPRVSVSPDGAWASLTVTDDAAASASPSTEADARTPTLSLAMGSTARPIETVTSPTNFTAIAPARCVELRGYVRSGNAAAIQALTGAELEYAKLVAMGVTTRAEPCWQATATRYFRLNALFGVAVGAVDATLAWADVVDWLGEAKARYVCPDTALKWRATGVTVAIRGDRWAEVSKTFEGAYWFPEALYGGA